MKNYLVEVDDIKFIVGAKTELEAITMVEEEYSTAVYFDQVTKLKKRGIIYDTQV